MSVTAFLDRLERSGVSLTLDGDRLRCRAPRGVLTDALTMELQRLKPELIAVLHMRSTAVIAPRAAVGQSVPLTAAQRQLWFLDRLNPGGSSYNNPIAIRFAGPLDIGALAAALHAMAARHAVLRTVFVEIDGEPHQRIGDDLQPGLTVVDIAPGDAAAREAELLRAMRSHAEAPFDLCRGPLLRSSVCRMSPVDHVWLVNLHHIVADGWSIGIFLAETARFYAAHVDGTEPGLVPLAIQYADYALWERAAGRADDMAQLDYWRRALDGAPQSVALPLDRPRPPVRRHDGGHVERTLPDVGEALRRLCDATGTTRFSVMLAVHAAFLYRYSGETDVVVGTVFANRDRCELEPLIGHFINTLALRVPVDPAASFEQLLGHAHAATLAALDHCHVPYERVVQAVNPPRRPGYAPLFQTMLLVQNLPSAPLSFAGLAARSLDVDSGTAKFDLTFQLFERGDAVIVDLEYDSDLFDRTSAERMLRHFGALLTAALARPGTPVGRLPMLDDAEIATIVDTWGTRPPFEPAFATILAPIAERMREAPDAVALLRDGEAIGRGELNLRSARLARYLRTLGIGRGSRVGICMERSCEMVVAMLAVLRAGAAYVPLDPALPTGRIAMMVADASPAIVLTHRAAHDVLPPDVPRIDVAAAAAVPVRAGPDPIDEDATVEGDDVAYVLYTSGSTGRPKGVAVTHRGLANLIGWTLRAFPVRSGDALLQKTSFGFDAAVWEFFWPLASGARLVLAPPDSQGDPAALAALIRRHGITAVQFVPTMLALFLETVDPLDGATLRDVFCGGEPLSGALARRFRERLPRARLHNVYGPTETTVDATCHHVTRADEAGDVPIGTPIAGARIYVLDDGGSPVPPGVAGEIHIGGRGVARGYLAAAASTGADARFLPDPFAPGGRMYRTGDLGRWRCDGVLEFLGRRDLQVKLRGYRIEPGEVEARLLALPDVREAAVLVQGAASETARLVAYVAGGAGAVPDRLRAGLAGFLPGYMIPSDFVRLERLPTTPSGKIDRTALATLAPAGGLAAVNQANPRDGIELVLYDIWKSVLLHPSIGIRDSFFDVGGTSISAIKVLHRINVRYGLSLPLRTLLSHATIEGLAGVIRAGGGADRHDDMLIRFRSGAPNVICVHPAGGTAFCYLSLARILPQTTGVYGIQSPGIHAGEMLLPSIEAMAAVYLERIAAVDDGPLVLLGLSFGGLVAYEMGRRMALDGRRDVAVILLDTHGTDDIEYRRNVAAVDLSEFRDKLVRFNGTYPGIDDDQIERYFRVYNHNRLCVRDYAVPVTPGRVIFLQARGSLARPHLHEVRRFWRARAGGGLRTRLVAGDHWEMLESEEIRRVGDTVARAFAEMTR